MRPRGGSHPRRPYPMPATMRRIARSVVVTASWRLVERSVVDLRLRRGGGGDRRRPMKKAPRTTVSSCSPQVNSIAPGPLASAAAVSAAAARMMARQKRYEGGPREATLLEMFQRQRMKARKGMIVDRIWRTGNMNALRRRPRPWAPPLTSGVQPPVPGASRRRRRDRDRPCCSTQQAVR